MCKPEGAGKLMTKQAQNSEGSKHTTYSTAEAGAAKEFHEVHKAGMIKT
jgi:hypothetical protein